jgi:DNA-directed RNA polymerase subunit K/omega
MEGRLREVDVFFRRIAVALVTVLAATAARADALTIRDVIELSKAGLGDPVLIALIEVDRGVFSVDIDTLKKLKDGGVSEPVIVALIRSGRTPPPAEAPAPPPAPADPVAQSTPREPQVIVIDHHDPQPAAPQTMYPVAVSVPGFFPGFVSPTPGFLNRRGQTVNSVIETDQGLVRARVPVPPNCVKAEPVFWGFGGKLRPGSYSPPPTVVCR